VPVVTPHAGNNMSNGGRERRNHLVGSTHRGGDAESAGNPMEGGGGPCASGMVCCMGPMDPTRIKARIND